MKTQTILSIGLLCFSFNLTVPAQWVQTAGPGGRPILAFATSFTSFGSDGMNLFGATGLGGVFLSTNNGANWTAVNNGLSNYYIQTLLVSNSYGGAGGTNLFAGTSGQGVFVSANNGKSWNSINDGLTNLSVNKLAKSGNNLFAGTEGGVFISTNNGTKWKAVNSGLTNTHISALTVSSDSGGEYLFAGTSGGGVFRSINNGTSWNAVNSGLTNNMVHELAHSTNGANSTNLFAGTDDGVFVSMDNGMSWMAVNDLTNTVVVTFVMNPNGAGDNNLFAGDRSGQGVFLSTDNGTSWTSINSGLINTHVYALTVGPKGVNGTDLFAGTDDGVFRSINNGASWTAVNNGLSGTDILAFAAVDANLFAGTIGKGIFLSADKGTNWTTINNGLKNTYDITSFAVIPDGVGGTNIFAGYAGPMATGGVFLSTNNGTNWTSVNNGLSNHYVQALVVSPAYGRAGGINFFAGGGDGVFLSTNNGTSWTAVNNGLNASVNTLVISSAEAGSSNIFAGTYNDGVFLSTNNGTSWNAVNSGLTNTIVNALALVPNGIGGTDLFAGTVDGMFLSKNNGTSWSAINTGLAHTYIGAFAVMSNVADGTYLFAGTGNYDRGGHGVFMSADNGTSWSAVNSGFPDTISILSLMIHGSNIFAGTAGAGVWRRPLSEMIKTSIDQINTEEVTGGFELEQNYPNPFYSTTTISYSLPSNEFVILKVFDLQGHEIATLVNEDKPGGINSAVFDGSRLASGIYYYQLKAGEFITTKKLLLFK